MSRGEKQAVRILLSGAGNVGRRFLELILLKAGDIRAARGLDLVLVGVADSSGAAACADGLDARAVVALKMGGRGVAGYPACGMAGRTAQDLVDTVDADVFVEASPANLRDGQPALGWIEAALAHGMHAILANKAPLVHGYAHLLRLAAGHGVQVRFDATVAGGLPVVNLGQRDLAGAKITRMEGLLNLTTSLILGRMAGGGLTYAQALAEARAAGHAETDPTLDVEGWDAAVKLVILAQSVLGMEATLSDVTVAGITSVTREMLLEATSEGSRIKLVALADLGEEGYRLSVGPTALPLAHPLAQLGPEQMGVVFHTDVCGAISAAIVEETPMPTAFAVLRDLLDIYHHESLRP